MRIYRMFLIAICLLVSLLALTVIAQDDEGDGIRFTVDDQTPVMRNGRAYSEWDGRHVVPAAVFYHDGQFHMFRSGYRGWPLPAGVGYAVSDDGLTWVEPQESPVLPAEDMPFADDIDLALLSSGFVDADGTWVLYFFLFPSQGSSVEMGMVRATAPEPLGPWVMGEDVLLVPGSEGEWDSDNIGAPHVMLVDGEYRAYYFASGGIGMATSSDGLEWTKYDDPNTAEAPYAESDPVFLASEDEDAWDYNSVADPTVLITPDGWVMLYDSFQGVNSNFAGGSRGYSLALSEDGIHWERLQAEPMWLNQRDMRLPRDSWYGQLAYHDEIYYLYLEINTAYGTDIFGGTYEGLLAP